MSITPEKKSELIKEYCTTSNDTGSSFIQCAILTERISNLTNHFKIHRKDYHSKRGLLILVGRRRRHLNFIKRKYGDEEYKKLIVRLGIRK